MNVIPDETEPGEDSDPPTAAAMRPADVRRVVLASSACSLRTYRKLPMMGLCEEMNRGITAISVIPLRSRRSTAAWIDAELDAEGGEQGGLHG